MRRTQEQIIRQDLDKKMVFLVGPRQVGKTWLATKISESYDKSVLLNYDSFEDREIIKRLSWPPDTHLLVLDELHKMPAWKNWLKGVYDTRPKNMRILVTGSARLDTFRQTGDSLAGRFFAHRLMPFSPSELAGTELAGDLDRLMQRGGFPEPLLATDDNDANRWRLQYADGLIRSDVSDFANIHRLREMQLLLDLLRHRVGSRLSYQSIAEDLSVSPNTARKYVEILEALFIVFRVFTYEKNVARTLKKDTKIYFYDTGMVHADSGARFENLLAVSLLKNQLALTDQLGKKHTLHYIRTKDGREVDFCLAVEGRAHLLIEAKYASSQFDRQLIYFSERLGLPGIQLVHKLRQERHQKNCQVLLARQYLESLSR